MVDRFAHELVSEQAQRTPEALAIAAHDGQITYKQLDDLSSVLALQLKARGIGLDSFVPLCFEKSLWVPVAMIAVLKSGAAFTAMDISHPENRLKSCVKQLDASLVLTSADQVELAKKLASEFIIVNNASLTQAALLNGHSASTDCSAPSDTNRIMYVAFISGSCGGAPKGVMVTHKNLASAAKIQAATLGFGENSRVFDFSSYSFDATIWHTYFALTTGGCLCTPSEADRIERTAETIDFFQSNIGFLTSSLARSLDPT